MTDRDVDAAPATAASLRDLAEEYIDKQLAIVAPGGVSENERERLILGAMRIVPKSGDES